MKRRTFLKDLCVLGGGAIISTSLPSLFIPEAKASSLQFEISLAQWSLHKSLFSGKISTLDFPGITKNTYGLSAVEYVNQFFKDKAEDAAYLQELKNRCNDNGVYSHLIMVDQEGELSSTSEKERNNAVENHYKWITAAKELGCTSIRVNLHGHGYNTDQDWVNASVDGLGKLVSFSEKHKMNVLVENHGQLSSKGNLVAEVMKQVNNPYCGTLPDFGNFCVARRDGDLWESPCIETYDYYKGVKEMLPYAKGISAKAFLFDENGNEPNIDYNKLFKLIQKSGFNGYVGIEYEGDSLSEEEGIKATIALLEKTRKNLNK